MNLLKAALYDPAGAVSKATSSLLAMTAFDTTNLRLAITVPAHGMVKFILRCTITGATTFPTILLGVMNGATVIGRVSPLYFPGTANAATQDCTCVAEFTATGLTPGAMNVDAAYGVEVVVAATNVKYGGPNNTTTNDAWGGFAFEAWDPQPQTITGQLSVDANGRVDVIKVAGTTQTARDLGASVLLSAGTGTGQLDFTSGVVKANLAQILGTALTETAGQIAAAFKKFFDKATPTGTINSIPDAVAGAAGGIFIAGSNAATTANITGNLTGNVTGSVGSVTARVTANTDQLASQTVTAAAGVTFPASVASPTNITAGTITTATNLTNAPTSGDFTAAMKTSLNAATPSVTVSDKTGFSLTIAYELAKTAAQAGDAMTLTAAERNAIADALIGRNVSGGSSAGRTIKEALAFLRNKWTVAAGTLTVYDTDDTAVLWTATVTETAGADPVTGSDPA